MSKMLENDTILPTSLYIVQSSEGALERSTVKHLDAPGPDVSSLNTNLPSDNVLDKRQLSLAVPFKTLINIPSTLLNNYN